jgi:membrane-bound lytic murein transglycosylase F
MVKYGLTPVLLLLLMLTTGLVKGPGQGPAPVQPGPGLAVDPGSHQDTGDLGQGHFEYRDTLKVVLHSPSGKLALSGKERTLLLEYAQAENLNHEWIVVNDIQGLLSKLASGEADIVASLADARLTTVEDRILFTLPWAISKQQVVGRSDSNAVNTMQDLTVRQLALKSSSAVWKDLTRLAADHQSMEILQIPEHTPVKTILERVNSGQYDLAVLDSLSLPADLKFHYNLEAVLDLSEASYMSWGVNPKSETLHTSLNKFLSKKHLESGIGRSYRDDFPEIKQRKLLRLITYQSPVNYFYERGRLKGFEYDLIRRFAEQNGMRLDVVIADSHESMLELLNDGKGDIIAASVPENRYAVNSNIKLSDAYNYASPVLVGREGDKIIDFRDLQGRTIHLPPESPFRRALNRIKDLGIEFSVLVDDPEQNTESVLFRVAQGIYDVSVISSHEVKAELSRQLNLEAKFNLGDPKPLVWAVRDTNTLLLSALNEYIAAEYRKGFYNVIYARYINNPATRITNSRLFAQFDQLSPYDELVHKYADYYGFDWRLIVAQMYQESRFNPRATSEAGAEGLMQLLPTTAAMVGISDPYNPDNNIAGGVRYMDYLRGRFEDGISVEDRTWFTLASYNAGFYRVKRARELAESMGMDKNKWFNNVETAMLKLARPYLKDGVAMRKCRCGQAATYVREIRTLYNNYLRLTQSVKAASKGELDFDES